MRRILAGAVFLAIHVTGHALDCFEAAALYQGVHVGVLRAISIQENPKCDDTIRTNKNNTTDTGCMQINSTHHRDLAKHGLAPADLNNQCINIFVGAWHYRKKVVKYGNTWKAVGAYHSENAEKGDPYQAAVKAIYLKYKPWLDPQPGPVKKASVSPPQ